MHRRIFGLLVLAAIGCTLRAQSVYPVRLQDSHAVYLTPSSGTADDTLLLQNAIDRVADTTGQGIVFLAEGRYRLSHTVYIWPGVRLIGYGAHRPVLALAPHTPGYQTGMGYMLFFAGGRPGARSGARPGHHPGPTEPFPGTVPSRPMIDANPGTFYSALSNVDIEIGPGNPAAVAIRSHYAQHCFLSHIDFALGSGLAGIHDAGNIAFDLHFHGGDFGIITEKPSPGWQFTLLDSTFDHQRTAAIREHEAGLTMLHDTIRDTPEAISIDPGYAEELWISDSRFDRITRPAITISNDRNARTEINLRNILCRDVPTFAKLRESGQTFTAPSSLYRVTTLTHGLKLPSIGDQGSIDSAFHTEAATSSSLDAPGDLILREPPTSGPWANARSLGATGDGLTDDTAALQSAIDHHPIVYLPSGRYRLTHTLRLAPHTILVGLHPSTTELILDDSSPAFMGPGDPVPMLLAPPGSDPSISGIGLYAGGRNNRATAILWQAGAASQINDVRLLGGHGTNDAQGHRLNPYNANHSGDPDPTKRWDGQFPSLWVLGGGGTFADIWTPDTFAQAGLYVSDTSTPGRVFELSSEHHVRNEAVFRRAHHWSIYALQTEEEWGEGGHCLPLSIEDSSDLLFANMHSYRVVGSRETLPAAIRLRNSSNIRFRNLHVDSDSKVSVNNSVLDDDSGARVRLREFASLDASTADHQQPPVASARLISPATPAVTKLVGGFYNISGAAADPQGRLLFVDPSLQRIYRWSPATHSLDTLRDAPLDVTNLAVDHSGNVLAISYRGPGTVYTFNPAAPPDTLALLKPQPAASHTGATAVLPVDHWNLRDWVEHPEHAHQPFDYISPDGSVFLPASEAFVQGQLYYGTKMAPLLRSFALSAATAGQTFYLTSEEENKTYAATVAPDGSLTHLHLFAERGGEGVTTGPDGHVFLAAGEVYEYTPDGQLLRTIHIPERPTDLVFAGPHAATLFILARTSLYAWTGPAVP